MDPSRFIALSSDYEMVCDDYRMRQLRDKVNKNGWNDPDPSTLKLTRLPHGDYVVDGFGNHRALLANEMGLKQIFANVRHIYHISTFPQSLFDTADKLMKEYRRTKVFLDKNFDPSNNGHFKMINRLDVIDGEVDQLYYNFVKEHNLI